MIRTFIALLILSGAYDAHPVENESKLGPPEKNISVPENLPLTVEGTPSPPDALDFSSRVSEELEESTHPPNSSEESDLKTDATFWWPYYRPYFRYPRYRYYRPRTYYRRHYYW